MRSAVFHSGKGTIFVSRIRFHRVFIHRRDQYNTFLSDILHPREKENKSIHDEVHGVFVVVNVEEESSTVAGLANLDRRLCEQVFEIDVFSFVLAVLYQIWR